MDPIQVMVIIVSLSASVLLSIHASKRYREARKLNVTATRMFKEAEAALDTAGERETRSKQFREEAMRAVNESITAQMLIVLEKYSAPTPGCTCAVCDERRAKAGAL